MLNKKKQVPKVPPVGVSSPEIELILRHILVKGHENSQVMHTLLQHTLAKSDENHRVGHALHRNHIEMLDRIEKHMGKHTNLLTEIRDILKQQKASP